jgi:hypothetical protein
MCDKCLCGKGDSQEARRYSKFRFPCQSATDPRRHGSRPLTVAASKTAFQVLFILLAGFFAYRAAASYEAEQRNGRFTASAVRFRALETRAGLAVGVGEIAPASIGSFGLLWSGCRVEGGRRTEAQDGLVTLAFDDPVQANGYYFVTSNGTAAMDPVRWVVEAAVGNGSWVSVGAGVWAMTSAGVAYPYPELAYPTPTARGETVWMDQRYSWPLALQVSIGGIEWAIGFFVSTVMGRRGHISGPLVTFISCAFLDTVVAVVSAVGFRTLGDWRYEAQAWLLLWPQAVFLVGLLWFESHIIEVLAIYSASIYATTIIIVRVIYGGTIAQALVDGLAPGPAMACTILDLVVVAFRWRALRRARLLVEVDQGRYSHAWTLVQQAPGAAAWIRELKDLVAEVSARCPHASIRQEVHLLHQPMSQVVVVSSESSYQPQHDAAQAPVPAAERPWLKVDVSEGSPVTSLDQLYVQAVCLYPVLLRKVQAWAAAAEGQNQILRSHSAPPMDSDFESPLVEVRYAGIKSVARAVEKSVRSYARVRSRSLDTGCRP